MSKSQPKNLTTSVSYLSWDNPLILKAFRVIKELDHWTDTAFAGGLLPIASIVIAKPGFFIMIADIVVWSSDDDEDTELTFECCKDRYREIVRDMMSPFLKEKK